MVINIGDVKSGCFDKVLEEIKLVKKACGEKLLKVIIETCYLTEDEKVRLCGIVTEAGADFIKTSTGFGTAGATLEDVKLFKQHIGPGVKIKAAGGVKTREDLETFITAGASRIGTSSAVKLLTGGNAAEY
jgi:deoxyribose-phosphate aldolase